MRIFGPPGHFIRNGRRALRPIAAKTLNPAAAIGRDTLTRWRRAMTSGLTGQEAAEAVGAPRPTFYRWQEAPEPESRRPHRLRKPAWSSAQVKAVGELGADKPMWGKHKLGRLGGRAGLAVSTVGRIPCHHADRGVVRPMPALRGRPAARRLRMLARTRHAKRPHCNGTAERCSGTRRYEFYACHDLPHRLDHLARSPQ
ncbi:MAG: hypothetical protein IRY89_02040 [Pseudolabrys sp.]|nr:hypothetical protein [Pseudolabrys sp.]